MQTEYSRQVLFLGERYSDPLLESSERKEEEMLTKEKKAEIIKEYGKNEKDTGSPEVQIALLSYRIAELTEHLKSHANDNHSRRGLYMLIGQRRGLLNYLYKLDIERYRDLIARLNLRG